MYKKIINENSKIYLNFGYLMIPVSLNIIPKIKIGTHTFYSKNEYHVSLLRLEDLLEHDQKEILNFAQNFPVKLKKITKVFRLVIKENDQSIIVRVRLKGLRKLISQVNKRFGYNFVYPPTHITLFKLKDMESGIGVNSYKDYNLLTHQMSKTDSQKLTNSFKLI